MAAAALPLDHAPRRGKSRLRLGIPAALLSVDGRAAISLLDLSESGARILLPGDAPVSCGFLRWMDYEAFASVSWRDGRQAGLRFEEPIERDWLLDTREWLPALANAGDDVRRYAKAWVRGDSEARTPRQRQANAGPQAAALAARLEVLAQRTPAARRAAAAAWLRAGAPFIAAGALLGTIAGYLSRVF
jgi:hypothetical protein